MPRKLTHDEFVDRVTERFSGAIRVAGIYAGRHDLIDLTCTRCGHQWRPYAGNLLNGIANCKRCSDARKTPPFDVVRQQIVAACGNRIEILGPYVTVAKPLPVRCTTCSHEWGARITDLRQGHTCPRCAGKLLDHAEVVRRIEALGKVRVRGQFTTTGNRIAVECVECGHRWSPTANAALMGHGCAGCNRKGFNLTKPAVLYCFRFVHASGATLFKIGITNRSPLRRYEAPERRRMTLLHNLPFPTGAAAREAEQRLIATNAHHRFHGETGFSFTAAEVFLCDVLAAEAHIRSTTAIR